MSKNIASEEGNTNRQQPKTAIIIANPMAGSYQRNRVQIEDTIDYLQKEHDWQVTLELTQAAGDGARLAKEAVKQKLDVVIAVGGDGTINEIIQELAGSTTALGVLPGGTVNVWAREVGIPLTMSEARQILVTGQIRRIDLGQIDQQYFLLMASMGFDAEVAHTVEKRPVKRFGVPGYLFLGTWLSLGYPTFIAHLTMNSQRIRARTVQIVFGNTQLYAGAIRFTWQARCDDGLLDICLIRKHSIFVRALMVLDFLFRRPQRQQWVRYDTSQEVTLSTNKPVAIQVDGNPAGYTNGQGQAPTVIRIVPQALNVIVPQNLPPELFSDT